MAVSRDIPEPVKLQLRKQAGFGCCVCGHPFYEYQHIKPFSIEPHHNPRDMMVLCPNHHHQATVGGLNESQQRRYKKNPFNIRRGYADGQMIISSRLIALQLGTNQFVGAGFKLMVDGSQVGYLSYSGGLGTTSGGTGNYEPITLGVGQQGSGNQSSAGWNRPFHGRIDEVAIFNRGVTETEANWQYQSVIGGTLDTGSVVRDGLLRL